MMGRQCDTSAELQEVMEPWTEWWSGLGIQQSATYRWAPTPERKIRYQVRGAAHTHKLIEREKE